jgi:hypothetical protein
MSVVLANWKNVHAQAYAFETPMRYACTGLHTGILPVSGSVMNFKPAEFVLGVVKQSGTGNDWLVRGYNITGEPINVMLKPWKLFKKVEQVNLAEEKQVQLIPDRDGSVTFPVGGHEII